MLRRNDVAEERLSIGDFVSSIARFSWSTMLFGIGQIGRALRLDRSSPGKSATNAFDSVTAAVEAQLGDGTKMIFNATNPIQRSVVDVMSGVLTPQTFTPRGVMKTTLDTIHALAEAPRRLMPEEPSGLAWQEFQNKLETFSLFEHVDLILKIGSVEHLTLSQLMARATSLGSYRSVWAIEGVGHYNARCMRAVRRDRGILQSDRDGTWPTERLAALHAGMGLSFASEVLETVRSQESSAELRKRLEEFFSLCRKNSHEGYLDAAHEALGLVARNLYPHMLGAIDSELTELDHRLVAYFWHGVGRAMYFAPSNLLPGNSAPWGAVEIALSEPPHELGRLNALGGLIWSLALVNLRQPAILELFLKYHWPQISETDVFEKSLSAALLIWRDSTPDDTLIQKLASHQPSNPAVIDLWDRVRHACADASEQRYLSVKENNGLGSVFRC